MISLYFSNHDLGLNITREDTFIINLSRDMIEINNENQLKNIIKDGFEFDTIGNFTQSRKERKD